MKRLTLLLTCLLISMGLAIAQNKQVSGTVIDEKGEVVVGASVIAKGAASIGTTTDTEGNFLFSIPVSVNTLVVKYIGYVNAEIAVGANVKVVLYPATSDLSEVVVVAYGTQRRSTFTGALSSIKSDKIEGIPVTSLDQALKGNVAGLTANTGTGQPGADTKVIIRGVGSINAGTNPLYVVDGVPITTGNWSSYDMYSSYNGSIFGAMSNLNPNDIESVSVLKDASATAIYGSRAANGVIVISTKQGKQGKTQFNFSAQAGFSGRANTKFRMLNRDEFLELAEESYRNYYGEAAYKDILYGSNALGVYKKDKDGNFYDTNWLNEAYRTNALTQSYELSAAGGNEKTNYFFSLSRFGQEAIVRWGDFERTSARINLTHKANNRLKFGANSTYSYSKQDTPLSLGAYYINPVGGALSMTPLDSPYEADGVTFNHSPVGNSRINFVETNTYNTSEQYVHRLIGSVFGEVNFNKDLVFKSLYGYDLMIIDENQYDDPRATGSSADNLGRASRYNRNVTVWNWANTLSYNVMPVEKNNISMMAGTEAQALSSYFMGTEVEGFASYKLREPSAGADPVGSYGESKASRLISYFAKADYNFDYRYYLSASFRYDGSSKFGKNHRFAPFWSVGASWNISEESFLRENKTLNQLRIRSSYGTTGNSDLDYYESYGLYSFVSYNGISASYPSQIANPDLKWETTASFNVGLDFRFLNRFGGTVEYYNKHTSDLLLRVPLSRTTGFKDQMRNIGKIQNRGVEITLSADAVRIKDFVWTIDANWAHNANKVLKLSHKGEEIDWGSSNRKLIQEGKDMFQYKLVRYAGVNPADGAQMWYDKDGELAFTRSYATMAVTGVGSAAPKGTGGLTNTFRYKNIDLSIFFFYQYGNKIFDNAAYQYRTDGSTITGSEISTQLDRWQKPGDISENPKRTVTNTTQVSTRFLFDGSYIRLKNARLGYTIPKSLTEKISVSSLRLFVQGQNLLTITDYPGMDPDVPWDGEAFYAYPTAKTWTVGLDVKF